VIESEQEPTLESRLRLGDALAYLLH
jgi:hypothetical protein